MSQDRHQEHGQDQEKGMSAAESPGSNGLEIAIVGMAGRFPGAESLEEFWSNLRDGVESLTVLGDELLTEVPTAMRRSPTYVRVARTIRDVDQFDAAFFGINPREADVMDPQHRLFLESCWTALEDAGYDPERYPGGVGVYAGSRLNFYLMNVYSDPALVRAVGDLTAQIANEKDYLATRVSYKLNLGGPSVTVQSACSTALVAVHMACQGLLAGECDMALAGGVAVRVPEVGYPYRPGDINSPDGRVRAFDAKAQGTIFGTGLGVVVLKRLTDALADGDTIHAVIKGSAVSNDGSQKVGFTAPGVDGQYRVIRAALTAAEVDPRTVTYVEAHGTGTPVGDPIEVTALTKAFREQTEERQFCALGSVKTNIGHLGAAAGIASLIKAVLALENRMVPPSLLFEEANPQIDFASSPFFVNTRLREWEANGSPRRAGVSAFGMGGTNAHAILEEAPEPVPGSPSRPWQLLLLSARTDTALATLSASFAAHLEAHPESSLADSAYTLQVGRKLHEHRRAVVCRDAAHAAQVLGGAEAEWSVAAYAPGRERTAAFLFSGQGAQYAGMGRGLYESEPAFRAEVDLCCDRLHPPLGLDLRDLLFAADDDAAAAERLSQTRYTQPALFVVEYALARLWMEWGVRPTAMMGHSIGEYVAACLAGVFTLDAALALVAERGRLMQSLPSGAMLAVPLTEEKLAPRLGAELSLAAVNAPDRCVVSGPHAAIEALRDELAAAGVGARPLHTSHAFHSVMMEPILEPFLARFEDVALRPPRIPYISNVTGTWITDAEATDPAYWARHLRQAVRFADGVRELCRDAQRVLLEVGPGQTLATLARQHPECGTRHVVLSSLRHPKERKADLPLLLKTLGQLWLNGVEPDWSGFYAHERRRRVPLPTYPFERRRYWVERGAGIAMLGATAQESHKKQDIADWFYLPYWKPSLPPVPSTAEMERAGRWLIFLDDGELGEQVVARLRGDGRRVALVRAGEGFRKAGQGTDGEESYEIAPARREDYDALIKDLAAAGALPDCALHLWNAGPFTDEPQALAAVPERSFWSLFYLAQTLARNGVTQRIHLAVASTHMQRVAGEERLVPERALLLGPLKTVSQELPGLRCVSVDVPWPSSGAAGAVAGRLIAEATAEPARPVVAYRGGSRWVQDYEAVRLEAPAPEGVRLRERGVYLITGGLGGLGLTFAEFLAREYRARLVLLGVSALPERATWNEWLAVHGDGDRISLRIRKIREIEELGSEVMVIGADVADGEQMRAMVEAAVARFGELNGVIHAAGLAGGGVLQLRTPEAAARVIAPKVQGTRALLAACAGMPLDFVAFCSSTIAVAGGFGQIDYSAANNFLDALAADMALAGGPRAVSINWGAWEEVGMAVAAGITRGGAASVAGQPAKQEDIHPLLDRCILEVTEQTIYETDLSAERHWVVREHRIAGVPTLPGTAYLELGRAAFLHHAALFEGYPPDGGVELRDIFFLSPLLLTAGGRPMRVFLEKDGDGFNFRVATRMDPASAGGEPGWQPHARGKVAALTAPAAQGSHDVAAILARCADRVMEITGPVMGEGQGLVYWGPRWQSLRRIHLGTSEGLAEIELPEELGDDTVRYGLHPALLDVATGIIGFVEEDTYLPLSYQRVRVHRHLPRRFYSYLRRYGESGLRSETIVVDVIVLGADGEVLIEIDHFTMKRVNAQSVNIRRPAAASSAEAELVPAAAPETVETAVAEAEADERDGILPHEGAEALRRALCRDLEAPQIVVTAKDLHLMIASVSTVNRESLLAAAGGAAAPPAATHERPNIPTPYVAPSNAIETSLAEVWQTTLGIERVGIHDNFFDLGGDSILGIQLIARAGAAGIQLAPDQLFEHQTIAELAKILDAAPQPEAEAAEPLPATAFQRELLAAGLAAPCWYAVWPLPAETSAGAEREVLRRALAAVVARHEALRTRFDTGSGGWTQVPVGTPEELAVREVDLDARKGGADVVALAREMGAALATERGLLAAAAVLDGGESPQRALLVVHPLAADGAGWELVRDEVSTACRQLAVGGEIALPPVTSSFRRWLAAKLQDVAMREHPEAAVGEWLDAQEAAGAPPPVEGGPAAAETASVRLSPEETRALLDEIPDLQRVRVEEVLLTALAGSWGRASGARGILVRVEVDARQADPLGLDLARAVGCFTVALPVRLDLAAAIDPEEELRLAKEQVRGATGQGVEAALIADLTGDDGLRRRLGALPRPALSLTYLGDAQTTSGPSPDAAVTVLGQLDGEGMRFDWTADDGLSAGMVGRSAAEFLAELRALIEVCRSGTVAVYTPSDFPDAELSQEELDKLFS
jgi:phthiocerol/phenolphthiocerol synthesis type-I polyketide synthase E